MGEDDDRGVVRLTLAGHAGAPDVDLDVADGVRLADLRPHLAAVTGRPELAGTPGRAGVPLAVEDVVLGDHHLTGEVPLVPGVVLRAGPGRPDPERSALRGRWHLAVVAGPDSGALVPLSVATVVGRAPDVDGAGRRCGVRTVVLADPTLSERQVELLPGRGGPRARELGSRNGTLLLRGRRPGRTQTLRRRPRRLAAGDRLVLGATVLELRGPPSPRERPSRPPAEHGAGPRHAPSTWVAPAAGAAVISAATGNRLLLLLAAVGPATALAGAGASRVAPAVRSWRSARWSRSSRRSPGPTPRAVDGGAASPDVALPVAADLRTVALRGSGRGGGYRAAGSHTASGGPVADRSGGTAWPGPAAAETPAPPDGRRGGGPGVAASGLRALAPDGCLAVVGPREMGLAVARLLACAEPGVAGEPDVEAGAHPYRAGDEPPGPVAVGMRVVPRESDPDAWRWARWLTAPPRRPAALMIVDRPEPEVPTRPLGVAAVLVVVDEAARVPPWCRTVLRVGAMQRAAVLVRPSAPPVEVPVSGVCTGWADRQARLLHAWAACGRPTQAPDGLRPGRLGEGTTASRAAIPQVVALADLPGVPAADPAAVLDAWGLFPGEPPDDRDGTDAGGGVGLGAGEAAAGGGAHDRAARSTTRPDGGGAGAGRSADDRPEDHGARSGAARPDGLAAVIGVGTGGVPVVLDLVRDGPHALVAGTTGAGKSALLQSWVLSLALTRPPTELAVLLVDYKGGAGFGPCARLPHVVAQVTDLDPALAARALTGLRAELHRREQVMARWSVSDLAGLRLRAPDEAPPRLLVVVDEFRALVDDLPGFVPGLLRIAAQGRSLGVHLVLATQRPGGAVGPDLRANLALRVALRVTDPSESLDVVGVPDAATIPAGAVGRALLRRGPAAPEPLQVAHVDLPPTARLPLAVRVDRPEVALNVPDPVAVSARDRRVEHPATPGRPESVPGSSSDGAPDAPAVDASRPSSRDDATGRARPRRHSSPGEPWVEPAQPGTAGVDAASPGEPWVEPAQPGTARVDAASPGEAWVEAARAAARRAGLRPPAPPWLPPLPDRLTVSELLRIRDAAPDVGGRLAFALADHPAQQRQPVVAWLPTGGPLLVVGGALSGRTTVLRTLTARALDLGWDVHAVSSTDALPLPPGHRGSGTTVGVDDPRRLARLATLLGGHDATRVGPSVDDAIAGRPGQLLLVDGLEATLEALAPVARGRGADRLVDLIREGRRGTVAVAATASPGLAPSIARLFTERLVLRIGDPLAESVVGVPASLVGSCRVPGRGVWLPGGGTSGGTGEPASCQVALPDGPDGAPEVAHGHGAGRSGPVRSGAAPARRDATPALAREVRTAGGTAAGAAMGFGAEPDRPDATDAHPATAHSPATSRADAPPALRLLPVPALVTSADLRRAVDRRHRPAEPERPPTREPPAAPVRRAGIGAVVVGLGGDEGGPVTLGLHGGALVAGPNGSGRSTALAAIGRGLLDAGAGVAVVARDGPLHELGRTHLPEWTCGHAPGAVVELLARCAAGARDVLLVDDLDALEQRAPDVARRVGDLVHGAEDGSSATGPVVVAAALTVAASLGFRGAVGALRSGRSGVVLTPGEPGSAEVFGADLSWAADPVRPHAPGRGVVVHGREVVPVQVALG